MKTTFAGITTTYVVMDENTLGYVMDVKPGIMAVLHGSGLLGGRDWKNGPVSLSMGVVRAATLEDFAKFKVLPPPSHLIR